MRCGSSSAMLLITLFQTALQTQVAAVPTSLEPRGSGFSRCMTPCFRGSSSRTPPLHDPPLPETPPEQRPRIVLIPSANAPAIPQEMIPRPRFSAISRIPNTVQRHASGTTSVYDWRRWLSSQPAGGPGDPPASRIDPIVLPDIGIVAYLHVFFVEHLATRRVPGHGSLDLLELELIRARIEFTPMFLQGQLGTGARQISRIAIGTSLLLTPFPGASGVDGLYRAVHRTAQPGHVDNTAFFGSVADLIRDQTSTPTAEFSDVLALERISTRSSTLSSRVIVFEWTAVWEEVDRHPGN